MPTEPKNIASLDLSRLLPNDAESDFKSEVVAAFLIEQGYDAEQISILREGYSRRGFSTDIKEVEKQYSLQEQKEYLYIKVNKEGMYDMLPQGLFHQPIHKKLNKDKEEILDEVRIHREEEFFARKFFQPFEVVSDETLTQAHLYETRFNKKISQPEFIDMFSSYWPILKLMERRQANYLMYIIPILHQIRNKREDVEAAFSIILDVPVKIENIKLPAKEAADFFESSIGNNTLGVDLVLGNTFDDGEFDLKVTLGPISALKMVDFLETGKGYNLLEMLCYLFLPAGAFVVKDFKILPEDSAFILSDEHNTTYLGINSFI